MHQAVAREVAEETGLIVEVGRLLGTVQRPGPPGVIYQITDHVATVTGGDLHAGDDASEVDWFAPHELSQLSMVDGLLETLRSWDAL